MLPGMDILSKVTKKNEYEPTHGDIAYHLFFKSGFTPEQFNEEFTIPDILRIIITEIHLKKKK